MRAVVQRVDSAAVHVEDACIGRIDTGLLVYLGCAADDADDDARTLAEKVCGLRIFPDDAGKMNRSVVEAGGDVLVVSAFTVQADARKGRRPSFDGAARPEDAVALYETFIAAVRAAGLRVEHGEFRAHMHVTSSNNGPICILLDSKRRF
jgi:D-tyrosyl-tRNA(Tyr) deacylase